VAERRVEDAFGCAVPRDKGLRNYFRRQKSEPWKEMWGTSGNGSRGCGVRRFADICVRRGGLG